MAIEEFVSLAESARSALGTAGQRVMELINPPAGPYALFHHQSHALERVNDTLQILHRLHTGRERLTVLGRQMDALRPQDHPPGVPFPPEMREFSRQHTEMTSYMTLDMESLYIFGKLLLDQWSILTAYMTGAARPEEMTFDRLVRRLETADHTDLLAPVWARCRREMLWLTYQVRYYRNRFMEHVDRPWQRGSTHCVYGDDFRLFMPSPPGWLEDDQLGAEVSSLIHLAPQWLQDQPEDYWERARPRALLERLFDHIGDIDRRDDRERISRLVARMGISTPSFQLIGRALLGFVAEATPVVQEVMTANVQNINLGRPRR